MGKQLDKIHIPAPLKLTDRLFVFQVSYGVVTVGLPDNPAARKRNKHIFPKCQTNSLQTNVSQELLFWHISKIQLPLKFGECGNIIL